MNALPDNLELESVACPICGPAPSEPVLDGHDLLHDLPGQFTVVSCAGCGLLRTEPRPSAETIGFYYPEDYGPYLGTIVHEAGSPNSYKAKLLSSLKRVFDTKALAIPRMQPGKMLEIGCASGRYLHIMAGRGWSVQGIEFSPEAAEKARSLGYDVVTGAVEEIKLEETSFDLVVGWMVLEHLHHPLRVLKKLRSWIEPNGKLVLSIPNAGSVERRIFGPRWYALQLPTHLYHYDVPRLRKLLELAGWRLVRVEHHRNLANFIASFGYVLRDLGFVWAGNKLIDFPESGGRIGALLMFPLAWIAALFGQTGRMTVWAEPN